ncbi:Non-specific lipid-transfer protein [Bienertia sinuspersici]
MRACWVVITILTLQHLPRHYSTSSFFQTLSAHCRTIVTELSPCADFIRDQAALPDHACCSGVHNLARISKTRAAAKTICSCLKQGLDDTTYDPIKVQQLPKRCSVALSFPAVNSDTDCSQ